MRPVHNLCHSGIGTALSLLLLLLTAVSASAQLGGGLGGLGKNEPVVRVTTYWSQTGVKPGGNMALAVALEIREPFHINSNRAKEGFIPTTIELLDPPAELQISTPVFPSAQQIEFGPDKEKISVFSRRAIIYVPIGVTSNAKPGERELQVEVGYQACDDKNCLFPTKVVEKPKLRVLEARATPEKSNPEIFAGMKEARNGLDIAFFGWDFTIDPKQLWVLLLVAAIGGFLLNFTPCVLPLIPIKIMGLSQAAGDRRRCFLLGVALSLGIVAFWLALAAAISSISGFDATNKLFQYPAFTIGVGVVIAVMAIGMCGFFSVSLPQWIYRVNPSQESMGGSFLYGIMTAILSTPCTAPFMGAAAAWSATQAPVITLSTFAVIGAGMALPYLVLSAFPFLAKRMPRTGPASELIKQVMGLLLLAAGAYFLGTGLAGLLAKPPDPPTDAYWWVVAFFVAAAGAWLAWRTFQITRRVGNRVVFGAIAVGLITMGVYLGVRFTERSPIRWTYYTPARFAEAQKQSRVLVLEFTAAWCLNCHALEKYVLHTRAIVDLLNSSNVIPIKVDITGNNPAGNQKLIEVGRRTIPYLVVLAPNGQRVFASDAYTVEQLKAAVQQALALR